MKRVVITSTGVVSPVGMNTADFWRNVVQGRHAFRPITSFDTSRIKVKCAAEIDGWDPVAQGLNKKEARRMDRYTQFAMAAAKQVVEGAGDLSGIDPFRAGVIVGSGIGGFQTTLAEHQKFLEKGPDRVSVFMVPMMISNMAAGQIAIEYGFKGDNFAVVTACATGSHSIGEAFRKIKYGYLDLAIAGGAEAPITEVAVAGFSNMNTLTESEDCDRLSIPFDKERSGFVMGEGAGLVLLEELEHARRRGANIIAEVVGYGATDDAHHITGPSPDGEGAAHAMMNAMADGGVSPEQVGYINAHGTSTQLNEKCETLAIKAAFGEHAYKLGVSSTKSVTGHMLGAAGGVETIATALALRDGVMPPTIGYRVPDEDCDLDYVTEGARRTDIRYALSNSLGFGGHNASLLFKKYEG
ncbi:MULTISPECIES: beta-ketoacyl-ACP synthase II [Anaerotruncus]|uniref:beta-ketoacyl-ACP synthase II n=1 Tax=Anaerotruncus TaxID=244127 RepID=UPI002082A2C3|nr:beta-ketoacyl-ACP synthase II [Anaerotruncus massiliensis (ex Togo et al. 2019)]GKH48706.1 3-oxoacyl-[acyl-carrier-protein] synthase 2 [Oscillospiraceae bacterium]